MASIIVGCSPSSTLLEVEELLSSHGVSRVVVLNETGSPAGIVSEKDVLKFMLTDNSDRGLEEVCAKEVMSSRLITINPEASIRNAADSMIRENISSLTVNSDRLEGLITKGDIVRYVALSGRRLSPVAEFMARNPITIKQSNSIFSTVQLMSQRRISRLIVVDQDQAPKGIITLADFTLLLLSFVTKRMPASDLLKRTEAVGLTAEDVMTCNPLTVREDADLLEAAELMMKHRFSGLPVIAESSRLSGIVGKTDIARAVANIKGSDIGIPT
ncbi:MAG TPA: CBS domain-containing protein [Terriglobales bacterium]|nr:CBS domain-containing protein [Terriglobales bacterium]